MGVGGDGISKETFGKKYCKERECYTCGKKGQPDSHCNNKKDKPNKDSDIASRSSNKDSEDPSCSRGSSKQSIVVKMKKDIKRTNKTFYTMKMKM